MCKTETSKIEVMSMINKSVEPIKVSDLLIAEKNRDWWFGPSNDMIDFLFSRQALGILQIDTNNGIVYSACHSNNQ